MSHFQTYQCCMWGSRSDSLDELYLCLSSFFISATVSTGVSQYMAVGIDDADGDGDDELESLDRFEEVLMATVQRSGLFWNWGGLHEEDELCDTFQDIN